MLTSDQKRQLQAHFLDKSSTGPDYFKYMVKLLANLDTDPVLTDDGKQEIWRKTKELSLKRISIFAYLHDVKLIVNTQRLQLPTEVRLNYAIPAFILGMGALWLKGSLSTGMLVGLCGVSLIIGTYIVGTLSPVSNHISNIDSVINNEIRTALLPLLFQNSDEFFKEVNLNKFQDKIKKMQQDMALNLCFKPRDNEREYEKKIWDAIEKAIAKATGERAFTPNYSNTNVEETVRRGFNYLTGGLGS